MTSDIVLCPGPCGGDPVRYTKAGKPTKYCSDNCRVRMADAAYKARQEKAALAESIKVHVKLLKHPSHATRPYLAEAKVDGKLRYRYGKTEAEAEARMREALRG